MKKQDWIFLGAVVAVAVLLLVAVSYHKDTGEEVVVTVEGKETLHYQLSQEISVTIEGKDQGTNHMLIHDGKVSLDDASCPDHLCVKQGEISAAGESIICLPNQVVVEIRGKQEDETIDGFSR